MAQCGKQLCRPFSDALLFYGGHERMKQLVDERIGELGRRLTQRQVDR